MALTQLVISTRQECLRHPLLDKSAKGTDPSVHFCQTRVPMTMMTLKKSVISIRQECLRHLLLDKSAKGIDPSSHFC